MTIGNLENTRHQPSDNLLLSDGHIIYSLVELKVINRKLFICFGVVTIFDNHLWL